MCEYEMVNKENELASLWGSKQFVMKLSPDWLASKNGGYEAD